VHDEAHRCRHARAGRRAGQAERQVVIQRHRQHGIKIVRELRMQPLEVRPPRAVQQNLTQRRLRDDAAQLPDRDAVTYQADPQARRPIQPTTHSLFLFTTVGMTNVLFLVRTS
jgi:hypothetical protein